MAVRKQYLASRLVLSPVFLAHPADDGPDAGRGGGEGLPALSFAVSCEKDANVLPEFARQPLPEPLPPEALPWRAALIRSWERQLLALAQIAPPGTFPLATWAGRLSDQNDRRRLAAHLAIQIWLVDMAGGGQRIASGSEASGES
jgi:hypothetical protein